MQYEIDQAHDIRRIAHALETMVERRVDTPFNVDKLIIEIMESLKDEEAKDKETDDEYQVTEGWIMALEWVLARIETLNKGTT